jgi:hypothetical protein
MRAAQSALPPPDFFSAKMRRQPALVRGVRLPLDVLARGDPGVADADLGEHHGLVRGQQIVGRGHAPTVSRIGGSVDQRSHFTDHSDLSPGP